MRTSPLLIGPFIFVPATVLVIGVATTIGPFIRFGNQADAQYSQRVIETGLQLVDESIDAATNPDGYGAETTQLARPGQAALAVPIDGARSR